MKEGHIESMVKYHNPDNLTQEQVGEGWRLLREDELNTIPAYPKNDETIEWWNGEAWDVMRTLTHNPEHTYRTRRSE